MATDGMVETSEEFHEIRRKKKKKRDREREKKRLTEREEAGE